MGWASHSAGNTLGLGLQQAHDEGATDALAVQVALVDPQVVEQGDVVGSVGMPAVLGGDGSVRPAAGVALIHGDHPEVRGERSDRVHRSGGAVPDVDDRLQTGGGEGQDGESLAVLFVIDGSAVVFKAWHVLSFRHRGG